jgi:hypothetical protein
VLKVWVCSLSFAVACLVVSCASSKDGDEETAGDGDARAGGAGDGDGDGDGDASGGESGDGDALPPLPTQTPGCAERGAQLPARTGQTVEVSPGVPGRVTVDGGETTLRSVIAGAAEGDTIVLAPGTYTFDEAGTDEYTGIYVTTPNITIRGSSADPTDVVLDSNYADHGMQTAVISLDAPGVVLAGFSVQRSIFHLIHLWENADDAIIFDVVMIDGG